MEITEQGWGRPAKDEEVEIKLNGIKYNSNKKPYALCEDLEGNRFKINISESDVSLQRGRYTMVCTNVTPNGYHYVQFERAQDSSWDVYDQNSLADFNTDAVKEVDERDMMLENIMLTKRFLHDINNYTIDDNDADTIYNCINDILKIFYQQYGVAVVKHMGDENELP